jgi:hypothetical protein
VIVCAVAPAAALPYFILFVEVYLTLSIRVMYPALAMVLIRRHVVKTVKHRKKATAMEIREGGAPVF